MNLLGDVLDMVPQTQGGFPSLRMAVRQLAVTGRLPTRATGDKAAVRLLVELQDGRERQDVKGPSQLPDSWCWARFNEVAEIASNLVPPSRFMDVPHVAPDNIEKGTGRLLPYRTIREDGVTSGKHRFFPGQILYSKIRPNLSKAVTVDFEGLCSADMYPLTPRIDRSYLHLFLLSPPFLAQVVREDNRLAMPKVNQEQLSATVVAVPPLAEQKRIVAKVDQLMALIDELEAKQTKKREVQTRFRTSALDALTKAEGPEELASAWKRVAGNFGVLFERVESVGDLRQVLLGMAIRGVAVEQRPSEGSGKDWVARLKTDIEAAGRPWETPDTDAIVADAGVPIPRSWTWLRLEHLAVFGPRNGYSPKAVEYPTAVKSLTLTATTSGRFKGEHSKYIDETIPADSHLWLEDGDVLIQRSNTIEYVGMAAVFRGASKTFIYPDLMMKVRLSPCADIGYLHLVLLAAPIRRFFRQRATGTAGTMPKINQSVVAATPVPLPPLAEQKRIVAKVEALMKLCDDLEAKLKAKEHTAGKLVEAVVKELVA
jgi:type I restriction enzyme S subunit